MKRMIPVLASLALLSLGAAAQAETADGVISGINQSAHSVTLEGGKTFEVAQAGMLNTLETGEHAIVTYHMRDGKMVASEIIAKSQTK
ncbi:MAG: DUF1344 domain-containing protein [Alphaproteobacteria bacterium]